jgi:hypothetical protein
MKKNEVCYKEERLPFRCFAARNLIKWFCCVAEATAACHSLQMISGITSLMGAGGKTELHGFPLISLRIRL